MGQMKLATSHTLSTPSLNPIKQLWGELDERLRKYEITTKKQLRRRCIVKNDGA